MPFLPHDCMTLHAIALYSRAVLLDKNTPLL